MVARHRLLVRVLVVCCCVGALALVHLSDLSRIAGAPAGLWGFTSDGTRVASLQAGTPAARAGLHAGQRIDLSENTWLRHEEVYLEDIAPSPNTPIVVRVRGAHPRTITLYAAAEPASDGPLVLTRELLAFVPLGIATLLLFLRPSRLTWLLFAMSLGMENAPAEVAYYRLFTMPAAHVLLDAVQLLANVASRVAEVAFAFSLAGHAVRGWRLLPVAGAGVVAVAQGLSLTQNDWMPSITPIALNPNLAIAEQALLFVFVLTGLCDAFANTHERARGKMLWLSAALLIAAIASTLDAVSTTATYGEHTALRAVPVLFLLLCAYALLSTRVIDIRFAISRTVVYGGITAVLVIIFALVDLVLTRGVDAGRLSLPLDVVIAVGMGFSIHNVQAHLDALVDRVLFHRRYLAGAGLSGAARAVLAVRGEHAVAEYVVDLPVRLLELEGAALYRRKKDAFTLEREDRCTHLRKRCDADDPLCAYLSAELSTVRIGAIPMSHAWPHDVTLAIPFVFRRELQGFVVYGAHRDGTEIDASEERSLEELVRSADLAYERIAAVEMEKELVRLRAQLSARLATS